jgi:hypothetical protein
VVLDPQAGGKRLLERGLVLTSRGSLHDDELVGQAYWVIRVTDAMASSAHGASS